MTDHRLPTCQHGPDRYCMSCAATNPCTQGDSPQRGRLVCVVTAPDQPIRPMTVTIPAGHRKQFLAPGIGRHGFVVGEGDTPDESKADRDLKLWANLGANAPLLHPALHVHVQSNEPQLPEDGLAQAHIKTLAAKLQAAANQNSNIVLDVYEVKMAAMVFAKAA